MGRLTETEPCCRSCGSPSRHPTRSRRHTRPTGRVRTAGTEPSATYSRRSGTQSPRRSAASRSCPLPSRNPPRSLSLGLSCCFPLRPVRCSNTPLRFPSPARHPRASTPTKTRLLIHPTSTQPAWRHTARRAPWMHRTSAEGSSSSSNWLSGSTGASLGVGS